MLRGLNLKVLVIMLFVFIFTGCVTPLVQYNKNEGILSLKIDEKNRKDILFDNPQYVTRSGSCLVDYYVVLEKNNLSYGNISINHIKIDTNRCEWNGLTVNHAINNIKNYFKSKKIKLLKKEKIGQYEFFTYELDNEKVIYLIEIWGNGEETFIITENEKFSEELKKSLKK